MEEINKLRKSLRKDLKILLLRVCTIVGPTSREGGAVKSFLSVPFGFTISGEECPMQFIHESDLLRIFDKILKKSDLEGIYNVAAHEYTTATKLSKEMGRKV